MIKKIDSIVFSFIGVSLIYLVLSGIFIQYPGLYMDSVNPDYLAAYMVNANNISKWSYPDNYLDFLLTGNPQGLTLLNSLYGAATPAYIGLIIFKIMGFNIFTIRFVHVLYGYAIVFIMWKIIKKITNENDKLSFLFTVIFALDATFMFSSRTQFYLQLFPLITFLPAVYLLAIELQSIELGRVVNWKKIFISNILVGLSATGYFIFAIYYGGIFIYFVFKMLTKKINIIKLIKNVAIPFIIGYLPFLYAHLSIFLYSGFDGYIKQLKNLDSTYGISDSQSAHVIDTLIRFTDFAGGNWLIKYITGIGIGTIYAKVFIISFILGVIHFIYKVIKNKKDLVYDIKYYYLIILYLCFGFHLAAGFVIGGALSYQHYIMLLPIMYVTIFCNILFVIKEAGLYKLFEGREIIKRVLTAALVIIAMLNVNLGYIAINKTGGIGYYSDVINRIGGYACNFEDDSLLITPQWGYWMGISLLTGGEQEIWISTENERIIEQLNTRDDVNSCYILVDDKTDREIIKEVCDKTAFNNMDSQTSFKEKSNDNSIELYKMTR